MPMRDEAGVVHEVERWSETRPFGNLRCGRAYAKMVRRWRGLENTVIVTRTVQPVTCLWCITETEY